MDVDAIRRMADIDSQIAQLQDERTQLERDSLPTALADALHTLQCRHNHTDGCGWLYETDRSDGWPWDDNAHRRWLDQATDLVVRAEETTDLTYPQLLAAVQLLADTRKVR